MFHDWFSVFRGTDAVKISTSRHDGKVKNTSELRNGVPEMSRPRANRSVNEGKSAIGFRKCVTVRGWKGQ